jgi:A/G-specific adenine glycosylase
MMKKFADKKWITYEKTIHHKLTHKNLEIVISEVSLNNKKDFQKFSEENQFLIITYEESHQKSFPKPLENFLKKEFEEL